MPSRLSVAVPAPQVAPCRVRFGRHPAAAAGADDALILPLPVLGGPDEEQLLPGADPARHRDGFRVFEAGDEMAGFAVAPTGADLEDATRDLYSRLLALTAGRHLYRIWNYVPRINDVTQGLENYRRFCRARAAAFEARHGAGFARALPAASAVGMVAGELAIAFRAGRPAPSHVENPQQIPAFEYPLEYGPRPPSFSRATHVRTVGGGRQIYVSGTAAIRGHATVAPNALAGQLACTRENLRIIARIAGAGEDFGAGDGWQRSLKVYVRRADDYDPIRADLDRHLLQGGDVVTYLLADLCRSDLLVEIEAVLTKT